MQGANLGLCRARWFTFGYTRRLLSAVKFKVVQKNCQLTKSCLEWGRRWVRDSAVGCWCGVQSPCTTQPGLTHHSPGFKFLHSCSKGLSIQFQKQVLRLGTRGGILIKIGRTSLYHSIVQSCTDAGESIRLEVLNLNSTAGSKHTSNEFQQAISATVYLPEDEDIT